MSSQFIGLMPPQLFLDKFMDVGSVPPAPVVDFSDMAWDSIDAMASLFINVVENSRLCPHLRLFRTKLKRRQTRPMLADGEASRRDQIPGPCDLVPVLAARKQPNASRHSRRRRDRDITEYYDFATAQLNIEVITDGVGDPFADPDDYVHGARHDALCTSPPRDGEHELPSTPHPPPLGNSVLPTSPHCRTPSHYGRRERGSPVQFMATSPAREDNLDPPENASLPGSHAVHRVSHGTRQANSRHAPPSPQASEHVDRPFERQTPEAAASRRSLMAHAQAQWDRQHRQFFFHLVLVNAGARFIRWDRAGAVVSERIDYAEDPTLLVQFLWRFGHMSDEQRGWDLTASRPSIKEIALFEGIVSSFIHDMQTERDDGTRVRRLPHVERTLDESDTFPTWKIRVLNEASGCSTDVLIRRPFTGHSGLFGRATRAYIAYDLGMHQLVFLKDSWRPVHRSLRPEFQTYRTLQEHHVPHIPTTLYGGDVMNVDGCAQETMNQEFGSATWRTIQGSLDTHVHHRIVQEIAYPLETGDLRELIQALHDVLLAAEAANESAGLLNRDISVRNVMLDSEGRGILNDWDHAGSTDEQASGIGTWKFMSIRLLSSRDKAHDIGDDLESVFWVFVYCSLKHFAPPGPSTSLEFLDDMFIEEDGHRTGGHEKSLKMNSDTLTLIDYTSDVLRDLMTRVNQAWQFFYIAYKGSAAARVMRDQFGANLQQWIDDAMRPSYWREMFADALKKLPPPAPVHVPPVSYSEPPGTEYRPGKRKRMALHDMPDVPLRRSKRIRTIPVR